MHYTRLTRTLSDSGSQNGLWSVNMEDPADEQEGTMATQETPGTPREEHSNGSLHLKHSISITNGSILCSCQPHIPSSAWFYTCGMRMSIPTELYALACSIYMPHSCHTYHNWSLLKVFCKIIIRIHKEFTENHNFYAKFSGYTVVIY